MSKPNEQAELADAKILYEKEKAEFLIKYPNEEPVTFEWWLEELSQKQHG